MMGMRDTCDETRWTVGVGRSVKAPVASWCIWGENDAGDLLVPATVSPQMHHEATSVQFPGLDGVLPGFGVQRPNDWGLGFEIKDGKSPHWTGKRNSAGTYGHFGQSGTFLWVDPGVDLALVVLTDRKFGEWAHTVMPALSDEVLREFGPD